MFNLLRGLSPVTGFEVFPNRLVPPGMKGEKYHNECARASMASVDTRKINLFRAHSDVNRRFVSGDQMIFKEDVDTFLMDSSEDYRNRILGPFNIAGTIWNKYRGTAAQMTFNATARSVTNRTKTRREEELAMLMVKQKVGATSPIMMKALQSENPLGENARQTANIFQNTYRDKYIKAHEHLLQSVAGINDFGKNFSQEASDLACTGALFHLSRGDGGDFSAGMRIDPDLAIWDTNASEYDLSDGAFMGCAPLMTPSAMYKRWNCPKDVIEHVETVMRMTGYGTSNSSGLLNVLQIFWKDIMFAEYGYVKGVNGYPELVPVNYLPPRAAPDEKPKYTDNDLVDPPDDEENRKVFGDQKKAKMTAEIIRYADMLPWEYMCGTGVAPMGELRGDIMLDYGVYAVQPYDPRQVRKVANPIQASCYALEAGEIVAPITDVIFPQRFFNRIMSVTEQQMNNAGSKTYHYNAEMLADNITPEEAERRQRRGGAIPMDTQGQPMQNAFAIADTTPSSGTLNYFQVGKQVVDIMRLVSSTPEPVTGQSQGDGLVRTTQMLIERAGILDEPFYTAFSRSQLQKYEMISTAGKEWYLQHPDILADLVDDQDTLALLLSRDYEMERFQTKVERSNNAGTERAEANQLILTLYQQQLLGHPQVADLFNRSNTDDVAQGMREYVMDLQEAQQQQAKEAQKAIVAGQIQKRGDELQNQSQQVYQDLMSASLKKEDNDNKRTLNYDRSAAKHLEPQPEQAAVPAPSGG